MYEVQGKLCAHQFLQNNSLFDDKQTFEANEPPGAKSSGRSSATKQFFPRGKGNTLDKRGGRGEKEKVLEIAVE